MKKLVKGLLIASALLSLNAAADAISDAVGNDQRANKNRIRDEFRHPIQTLRFFGIEPGMKVAEISPGGGWYTEILAPLLAEKGKLYAAHYYIDENSGDYVKKSRKRFEEKVKTYAPFKRLEVTSFTEANTDVAIAPANSLDAVVTFRNVHNWLGYDNEQGVKNAFAIFHKALKKGGTLGLIEHRMPEHFDMRKYKDSGYVKQSFVIDMAQQAGFELVAMSEVNANPNDTAKHPNGVWTLPPTLAAEDEDKAKYLAIGESDRMTLKFIKR